MSRGGIINLSIPHERQIQNGWCVPACVQMALIYLENCYGPGIECLSQVEIAKLCRTTQGGTRPGDTEELNMKAIRFIPSVEFVFEKNKKIDDIKRNLAMNLPIICFVDMVGDNGQFPHAILITGLNEPDSRVYFNNSMGRQDEEMDLGTFIAAWAKDFYVWLINIGRQRKIDDYFKKKR